ncbi:cryptochrome/photolyase family protein [Thalassotalea maritima]|uniref:cryptochrome/photolyase family protein n=1 Tax=Thalassotalea maritima TaxID=3242416 RepID=UPI0035295982
MQHSSYRRLYLIFGDQLNIDHSWFKQCNDDNLFVIAELQQELRYCYHHKQKIQAFLAAMQNFAAELSQRGFQVLHLTLEQTGDYPSIEPLLDELLSKHQVEAFFYMQPDEYRLHKQMQNFCQQLAIPYQCDDTEHFFLNHQDLKALFKPNVKHRMEHFYRNMRRRFNILMSNDQPEGGQWNYDKQNRHALSGKDISEIPEPLLFNNDVTSINQRLDKFAIPSFGNSSDNLLWPISQQQAKQLLDYFCRNLLANFGRFQDAMTQSSNDLLADKSWSLYHCRLSFALNSKLISPQQVIAQALNVYQQGDCCIASIEGFVRQILGWREFVRGMYWRNMPDYERRNALNHKRSLPSWFWTGNTKLNCLATTIQQSLRYGYAHHIQRLMITGNFCLIAGVKPQAVDEWYLGIYVDALQWVELANTRGMSQFADDGLIASKPYAACGNYINKMSDYCQHCHYNVKQKHGDQACPLNSLYWHFIAQHSDKFSNNPRMALIYKNWQKQKDQQQTLQHAAAVLANIEEL